MPAHRRLDRGGLAKLDNHQGDAALEQGSVDTGSSILRYLMSGASSTCASSWGRCSRPWCSDSFNSLSFYGPIGETHAILLRERLLRKSRGPSHPPAPGRGAQIKRSPTVPTD